MPCDRRVGRASERASERAPTHRRQFFRGPVSQAENYHFFVFFFFFFYLLLLFLFLTVPLIPGVTPSRSLLCAARNLHVRAYVSFAKFCPQRQVPPPPLLKSIQREQDTTLVSLLEIERRKKLTWRFRAVEIHGGESMERRLKDELLEGKKREGRRKERKRGGGGGGPRRNSLEGNGRGVYPRVRKRAGRGGGEGTRAGALTTSRRAHCIPRIPSPFAGRFEPGRPDRVPEGSNTIDRSDFALETKPGARGSRA